MNGGPVLPFGEREVMGLTQASENIKERSSPALPDTT